MNTFEELSRVDCSEHIEKKGGLTYLSWSWAVSLLLSKHPTAHWAFEEDDRGSHLFLFPDNTGEVRCSVTCENVTRTISLPIMDHRNRAIENPNACDVNRAKMRALAKGIALHGLGLYIYSGEDLPTPPEADLKVLRETVNGHHKEVMAYLIHNGALNDENQDFDELPPAWKKRAIEAPQDLISAALKFNENQDEIKI